MMVEARKTDEERPEADNAATADLSRLAEASSKLFAEQAAAMAVMTAYGMSVAAQMTGMMLGALRGPAADMPEAPSEPEAAPANAEPAKAEPKASAKIVPLHPKADKPAAAPAKSHAATKAKSAPAKAKASRPATRAAKPAPAAKAATSAQDDLKKISGLGPRLEQELNARGIRLYADIAALTKAAVKKLDAELGLEGRIVRDDWAGQARALSGGEG